MLTSLDFLKPGQKWPPECERDRLKRYRENRCLFENDSDFKWMKQSIRLQRMVDEDHLISYHIALNYPKKSP